MVAVDEVKDHAAAVRRLRCWDRVGVLFDEGPQALVTVLLDGEEVVAALRFCLPTVQSVEALRAYCGLQGALELRCWQGHTLTHEQLVELSDLSGVWAGSVSQSASLTAEEWEAFLGGIEETTRKKGRGAKVGAKTREQVLFDVHRPACSRFVASTSAWIRCRASGRTLRA